MAKAKKDVPPLVGRPEAAGILGVHPNKLSPSGDLRRLMPPPLQEEQENIDVSSTPLWRTDDIEKFRDGRTKG